MVLFIEYGFIQILFPAGDDDRGHAVAADIADRADHVQETVDAEKDGHAFCRQVESGCRSGDDDDACTGDAGDALGRKHKRDHDQELLLNRHLDAVELGDEEDARRTVKRRAVEVEGVARRHDKGNNRFRYT